MRSPHSARCVDIRKSPLVRRVRRLARLEDACVPLQNERPDANGVSRMRAEQQIQQLASEVGTSAPIETVVIVGSPAESIAQIAFARGVGLIVMGLRRQEHMLGPRQDLSRIACWVWRQPGC